MLLSDGLERFYNSMDGVLAPKTVQFYRDRLKCLVEIMGDQDLQSIELDHLRSWRSALAHRSHRWGGNSTHPEENGRLSPYTLHQYVRGCKRFFTWLTEEDILQASPAIRLELPELPKPYRRGLPEDDRDKILAAALASSPRDYAVCRMLADTACRVGGLAGLRLDDLDLDHRRAVVREKGAGGAGKGRRVFYQTSTCTALKNWLEIRPLVKHNFVWVGNKGEPLQENGIYELLERLAKQAGVLANWNPHNWRHGAIRGMLAHGMSLAAVSQIAGHTSVKTTGDLYGVFAEDELASQHDRYGWIE